jgi:zinc/manganese transport system substrate-binding protein
MPSVQALLRTAGAFSLSILLASCGAPQPEVERSSSGKRLRVVTTFLPMTLFTRAVAGECATITALIPANQGPHDFQAQPADLLALRRARVLVKNGLGMESFLDKLVDSSRNSELMVIDTSRGLTTIASPHEKADHPHDHEHAHAHGTMNPHIWLDPLRAVQQVETIRDGLVKADPSCAEGYRRNAETYIGQLRQLNSEIAAKLQPYRGKTFVAFHDVAPYFAQRYGLRVDALVDVPEVNPAPADLQRVAAVVKRSQLRALLSEPQEGNRSFNALARDLGVKVVVFDPIETATPEASRDPATYLNLMRRNGAVLHQAFGP